MLMDRPVDNAVVPSPQIEAYSLSQPTLEQVFLNVVGDQLSSESAAM